MEHDGKVEYLRIFLRIHLIVKRKIKMEKRLRLIGISSRLFVITAQNPIHSVFRLIGLFVRSTRLLFTLEVDFLAILLLVVYVGAIAVLFLFVIMMLHLNILAIQTSNVLRYLPIGVLFGFFFLLNILSLEITTDINFIGGIYQRNSISLFRGILYTTYFDMFIVRSLLLFIAMIGAIIMVI